MQAHLKTLTLLLYIVTGVSQCRAGTALSRFIEKNMLSSPRTPLPSSDSPTNRDLFHTHELGTPSPLPSRDTPTSRDVFAKREHERQLDTLGGAFLYDYRTPRDSTEYDDFDEATAEIKNKHEEKVEKDESKRALDTLGHMQIHGYKRALDTLGNMQIHGYKRGFDSLGGVNLHGGYKRYFSSLGGAQLHGYKRAIDTLGGTFIPAYKRYLSSLGGNHIHSDYKRYLSSLGGGNIYKRRFDSLGGMNLHSGYKRFLSSLGGAQIHDAPYSKRTLSSLGGVNVHDGLKREVGAPEGEQVFEYTNEGGDADTDLDKKGLDSLGGYAIHRYKRSDATNDVEGIKAEDMQKK